MAHVRLDDHLLALRLFVLVLPPKPLVHLVEDARLSPQIIYQPLQFHRLAQCGVVHLVGVHKTFLEHVNLRVHGRVVLLRGVDPPHRFACMRGVHRFGARRICGASELFNFENYG